MSEPKKIEQEKKTKSGKGRLLGLLSLACSIGALGAVSYLYVLQNQQQQVITQELDNSSMIYKTVHDLIKQQKSTHTESTDNIKTEIDTITTKLNDFDKQIATLNKGLIKAYQKQNQSPDDWVLHEVEYLIRIAHLNLQYVGNIPVSLKILKNAEARLQDAGNPALLSLRQKVSDTIVELKVVPTINMPSLMTKIQSMDQLIAQFPFATSNVIEKEQPQATPSEAKPKSKFKAAWQMSMEKLSKIVVIRKHDENVKPIIYPEHQLQIKENLHLVLEQMQWAILQKNQVLFNKNIAQAKRIIERYAKADDTVTQAFIDNLDMLASTNLEPKLPDISPLLKAVQESIQVDRHALSLLNQHIGG